jgi:hypothetical protein
MNLDTRSLVWLSFLHPLGVMPKRTTIESAKGLLLKLETYFHSIAKGISRFYKFAR